METKSQTSGHTEPIEEKEEVQKSNDKHIDQDFEGFPHSPAREEVITPESEDEHAVAGMKDGENIAQKKKFKKKSIPPLTKQDEEISSDGSANAFERTEEIDKPAWKHDKPEIDEKSKVY